VHFYNQRAEDSENRIKELKNDFGAKQMPCADFNANALYFDICSFCTIKSKTLPLSPIKWCILKSGLPINGFAFFINQRLPLVIFIYKNIFEIGTSLL
jgi:hypothetical protein